MSGKSAYPSRDEREQGEHGGDAEQREGLSIPPVKRQHPSREQWPQDRADLVQRLVEPEPPASPDATGRVGEHDVPGRIAHRLPGPLCDHQQRGDFPAAAKARAGTAKRFSAYPKSVIPQYRPVRQVAGSEPEAVSNQLAEPSDDANHRPARAQDRQKRTGDAPGPLVSHVREQADDPQQNDEPERATLGGVANRL